MKVVVAQIRNHNLAVGLTDRLDRIFPYHPSEITAP